MNTLKNTPEFICKTCDFVCSNKKDYGRHISTQKHKYNIIFYPKAQKTPQKFICTKCDFNCSNKRDYTRHLSTLKHKKPIICPILPQKANKNPALFCCEYCSKVYKHKLSLYNHKLKCTMPLDDVDNESNMSTDVITTLSKEKESDFKDLVLLLLKENQDIQKTFVELLPHIKGNNITSNSHNTTTNNQFNINMFLNEHCKNAMNLTDFIHSLPITNETYDNTIENGLTKSITTLITNGLNNMDVLERPIHCTDPSRKTMYIKDNNVWEKDNELLHIIKGIKDLSLKQRTLICKWKDANKGWRTDENLQSKMTNLVFNSMTQIESDEKETNKIIRAIGKNTYLSNEIKNDYL
jgi:hypothetical protein